MKRSKFFAALLAAVLAFSLAACSSEPAGPTDPGNGHDVPKLTAPVLSITASGLLSWNAVESAVGYVIYRADLPEDATIEDVTNVIGEMQVFNHTDQTEFQITNETPGYYGFRVVALAGGTDYTDSELSNAVVYRIEDFSSEVDEREKLGTPVVRLEGDKLVWAAVPNADRYTVYESGAPVRTLTVTEYTISVYNPGEYVYTVAALGDGYQAGEQSVPVTYTIEPVDVVYSVSVTAPADAGTVTVQLLDENGTVKATAEVADGTAEISTKTGVYTVKAEAANEGYASTSAGLDARTTEAEIELVRVTEENGELSEGLNGVSFTATERGDFKNYNFTPTEDGTYTLTTTERNSLTIFIGTELVIDAPQSRRYYVFEATANETVTLSVNCQVEGDYTFRIEKGVGKQYINVGSGYGDNAASNYVTGDCTLYFNAGEGIYTFQFGPGLGAYVVKMTYGGADYTFNGVEDSFMLDLSFDAGETAIEVTVTPAPDGSIGFFVFPAV